MVDSVVVINAGSSSLKFGVYGNLNLESPSALLTGQISGIGTKPRLSARRPDGTSLIDERYEADALSDHEGALNAVVAWLRSAVDSIKIVVVGHRVVHGGSEFSEPVLVTSEILEKLEALIPLAPLHQPANLAPIRVALNRMPNIPQIACFDSAFHRTHPRVADCFALPASLHRAGIRRYGFHGLSYEYIARTLPKTAPELASGRVAIAHLGSGASVCALRSGMSMDCTMSFTGLDGLPMGTRCGALDPAVVIYLIRDMNMAPSEVERILYHKSGLLGLSGESNDVRDLLASGSPEAAFALDYFVYRVSLALAEMACALEGIDGVVFTAGIGEHSPEIRQRICDRIRWMGIHFDEKANMAGGPRITDPDSPISAWVIPTDEESIIARHARDLLETNGETLARPLLL